ncbi:protease pro-enzyme activation domain-containing protein [Kutzneria buriramensis]|nr:protease pro-enzyme activation domain-containing protein [Kutzneria buriramensis]
MPGSVADAVTSAGPAVGDVPPAQSLTVQLWLKGNETAATAFADAVSNPKSVSFHKYLSPSAYTAKFGVSAARASAVSSWLSQQGFTDIKPDPQRSYIQATAPTSTVQNAFHVQMKQFRVAGQSNPVSSNDRDITLPASIAGDVIGVSGLDNIRPKTALATVKPTAAQIRAKADNCSNYYGQNVQTGLPAIDGNTSFPTYICGYNGSQLRAAYGMADANTGTGVTVAYIEIGTPYKMFQTLTKWAAAGGLPSPKPQNYSELSLGAGNACGNGFDIEEQLDIESSYAMAPDQHQLLVGADSCNTQTGGVQGLFDAENAVLDGDGSRPLASATSNSWGLGPDGVPVTLVNVMHSILLRAAGEGVGMYFASGDRPGVDVPSSDPYATAVGGTTLGLDAKTNRLFETGWSDDVHIVNGDGTYTDRGIGAAAGGGASLLWKEPDYQRKVVPDSMTSPGAGNQSPGPSRVVPDIGALADPTTGMAVATTEPGKNGGADTYTVFPVGGTSLSTPLVAGIVAAADQGQPASSGFINPLLYSLAGSSALADPLPITSATPAAYQGVYVPKNEAVPEVPPTVWTFDDQDTASTNQVTAAGYDTMTGVGTPNGQSFITALRKH